VGLVFPLFEKNNLEQLAAKINLTITYWVKQNVFPCVQMKQNIACDPKLLKKKLNRISDLSLLD